MDRTTGKLIGCLKFVEDGAKEREIEILQYLAALPSGLNHSVRPFGIWSVTGGSIIAMPAAGDRLTSLTDLDAHLWSLTRQLFEAVEFMHDHNVAHMDLKPANILVPSTYGRLTIIDFGISVRLRNKTELLQGYAGTQGYIAPEVGNTKFSPIRADLWSVGKIVKELCMLCRPSTYRDWLSVLSELLLNDNPKKRPMMSEVLEWMLNLDASETQPSGHLGYLLVTHHGLKLKAGASIKIESADGDGTGCPKPLQLRNGAVIPQTVLIRAVLQCPEAIRKTSFVKHAWPQFHKGVRYIRENLEGVRVLQVKNIEDDEGKQDAYRDWLSVLSELLLNVNPKKRPMISEVLEWMLNLNASETQHLRYLLVTHHGLKSKAGASIKIESADGDGTGWPKPLQLRNGAVIPQTVLIRAVLQCPEAIRKTSFGKQDAQYKAMIAQLSNDKKFSVEVCKWVCNSLVTS
jgi:serine/threonine protein kinase